MALRFIDVLRSYNAGKKLKVPEFVVTRDRVHVHITVDGEMSIEKAVQLIEGGFSYRAKKEVEFLGDIWQRGYADVRVKDEASFFAYRAYTYDNPSRPD